MEISFKEKLQSVSKYIWILGIILLVGIFLRTYNFHDWLRFNADQSRDAGIVSDVVSGKTDIPLLGPKAGGTNFRVGPAFYYFEYASAKVFGNYPDKMAYPDLLFSLLTIPLLFFFLRKRFDMKTALTLTALFAVSSYAIKYSRFAWNPNSLPFWSILFLYGLHEVMVAKDGIWKGWAIVTGIALGIGVQLHTLSLIIFPLVTLGALGYLLYQKKKDIWKVIFVIFFVSILLNVPQIVSEVQTGGENITSFFGGVGTKEKKGGGIMANTMKDIVCFSQSNAYILSSYDSSDACEIRSVTQGLNILVFLFGLIIFVGGFALSIRSFRREQDLSRKYFLSLVTVYTGLTFLILLPLANEVSMRFFLPLLFMPFVFLGLWFEFLSEKFPKIGTTGIFLVGGILIIANGVAVEKSFSMYTSYLTNSNAGMDNVLLKEVELSSSFILSHAGDAKIVAVSGDSQYLFKALKSMEYFTSQAGVALVQKNKKTDLTIPIFLVENTKSKEKVLKNQTNIADVLSFGRFTIFALKP